MEISQTLPKRTIRGEALIIAVLAGVAVAGLLLVFALVKRFHDWQAVLADRNYRHGINEMSYGTAPQAIEYFRSALFFQPDNFDYQLSLAQALEGAGRYDEAEAYLQNLWDREPQSGMVNLQLGRLAAHAHKTTAALRYYHNAIYGLWNSDSDQNRRVARVELVNFLIANSDITQAQAELIAMQAGLPADPKLHMQVANLFMRLPDYEHALAEFREARQLDRHSAEAAAGAGIAAFNLGRFRTAVRFLDTAVKSGDRDPNIRGMLETALLVLGSNPQAHGISLQERVARVQKNFQIAKDRLQQCMQARGENVSAAPPAVNSQTGGTSLQPLSARMSDLRAKLRRKTALNDPDFRDTVMDFVYDVEEDTEDACGTPTGSDLALLLLGRSEEAAEE